MQSLALGDSQQGQTQFNSSAEDATGLANSHHQREVCGTLALVGASASVPHFDPELLLC